MNSFGAYNPYQYNNPALYESQMNRLNAMQQGAYQPQGIQPQQLQQQQQQPVVGNTVTPVASLEEVKAMAVDWTGNPNYYVDNVNKKIYVKQLGLNGVPTITQYVAQELEESEVKYATKEEVDNLKKIIEDLLNQLGGKEDE